MVIVFSVLLVNFNFMLFILNSWMYCLIKVFFGLDRILINDFLFRLVIEVIIGRWLMNFGIRLNLIRFFGIMLVKWLVVLILVLE